MSSKTRPIAEPEVSTTSGSSTVQPRHIVENIDITGAADGAPFKPQQLTLCGKPWDRLFVNHNGTICQACVDEQKRRPKW